MDDEAAASAVSLVLGAIAVVVLDVRIGRVDLLSDPIGFALGVVAAWRLHGASTPTVWSRSLRALAPVAVVTAVVAEVGAIRHGTATGITATALVTGEAPTWVRGSALATAVLAPLGVILLARHLRAALTGVDSDRWRQVTIGWVATIALWAAGWGTGALELIVVAAMVALVAAVLLVLALLATRRVLEDGPSAIRPGPDRFR